MVRWLRGLCRRAPIGGGRAVGVLRAVGSIERAGLLTNLLTNASRRAGTQLDVTDGDRDEMAAQRDFVVQRDTRWHVVGWV